MTAKALVIPLDPFLRHHNYYLGRTMPLVGQALKKAATQVPLTASAAPLIPPPSNFYTKEEYPPIRPR